MSPRLLSMLTEEEKLAGFRDFWLEIWIYCHLRCLYCFNEAGRRNLSKKIIKDMLSIEEYIKILDEIASLGGKTLGIPGFGEPFFQPNIELTKTIIDYSTSKGMRVYVFSSGDLIDEKLAEWLLDRSVCLMVKYNSAIDSAQDLIVGKKGYTNQRAKKLKMLMDMGFNANNQAGTTMLGLVTPVLLGTNNDEIGDILRFCRHNNIHPDIDTPLHLGRGASLPNEDEGRFKEIFIRLNTIDKEEFSNNHSLNPCYFDGNCDRYSHHMYINCWGNISPCLGLNKKKVYVGNTKKITIAEAWNSPLMEIIRNGQYDGKCAHCTHFKHNCRSCFGRYADIKTHNGQYSVDTGGCWNFEQS